MARGCMELLQWLATEFEPRRNFELVDQTNVRRQPAEQVEQAGIEQRGEVIGGENAIGTAGLDRLSMEKKPDAEKQEIQQLLQGF